MGSLVLTVVPVIGAFLVARGRWIFAGYGLALAAAILWFLTTRGEGIIGLLWVVLIVVASDILGYFAGRILGGPKFWPRVSPKKTWSGAVAGTVGAVVVALLVAAQFGSFGAIAIIAVALLLSVVAQAGDLFESWVKRQFDAKDLVF